MQDMPDTEHASTLTRTPGPEAGPLSSGLHATSLTSQCIHRLYGHEVAPVHLRRMAQDDAPFLHWPITQQPTHKTASLCKWASECLPYPTLTQILP